ncbi:hypothetical protein HBH64_235780 [Parastagonospora nodorum]|nr:hypothetical protein HBH64_235780 [Parastagonospora nodorum]KAH5682581.1 hypothetical protein HBI21_048780 [Parastagonospora nodorum]
MRTSIVIAALAAFAVALPNPIPDVQDITNPAEHAQYRRDADAQTQPPRDAHTAAMLMRRPSLRGMLSTDADENSNYPARVVCGATALGTVLIY